MDERLTLFHRLTLWLSFITCTISGLGYYLAPVAFSRMLGVEAADPFAVVCIGGFLLGCAFASWLALRSNRWSEVRLVTYYIMSWNILNFIRMAYIIVFKNQTSFVPNAIITGIIGCGLAYIIWQREEAGTTGRIKIGR